MIGRIARAAALVILFKTRKALNAILVAGNQVLSTRTRDREQRRP
jgi:hypothetical protein